MTDQSNRSLIYNAIRTPDGTVLVSQHRHDYRTYTDANGHEYMVDGGLDYLRRGWTTGAPPAEEISEYFDENDTSRAREVCTWGTYGKNGDEPYRRIPVSEMSNNHIEACLRTQPNVYPVYRKLFELELAGREAGKYPNVIE